MTGPPPHRPTLLQPYALSGAPGRALIVGPIFGLMLAGILAAAYAYILVYSPIVGYVNVLFVGGFAFGLMMGSQWLATFGKCRSRLFMTLLGGFIGVVALYSSWVIFEYALFNRFSEGFDVSLGTLFLQPQAVWLLLQDINEQGWYSLGSLTPSGTLLWVLWGIEALVIVGAGVLGGSVALEDEIFCEACQLWCPAAADLASCSALAGDTAQGAILERLASGDVSPLESLTPVSVGHNPHLRLEAKRCGQCQQTTAFNIKLWRFSLNKKGEIETDDTVVAPWYEAPLAEVERLRRLADRTPVDDEEAEQQKAGEPTEEGTGGVSTVVDES